MITKRRIILTWMALFCCLLICPHANAYNKLSIPDVVVRQGGSIDLPVNLENDDQVVALQFTLTLPDGFTIDNGLSKLTNRCPDHNLNIVKQQGNDYLCIVFSLSNSAVNGNSGTVMHLNIHASNQFNTGDTFPLVISEAVASDKYMNNVLSESSSGSITINSYIDFAVNNITTDKQHFAPGDHLVISWQVKNVGELPAQGGWSEQLMLANNNGTSCLLATSYYQDILNAGGTVSRQTEVIIPQVPGIHGNVVPQVRLVPNSDSGERPEAQANNTSQGSAVELDALLYVDLSKSSVDETNGKQVNGVVTRSGNRQESMVVSLSSDDERLNLPTTLTIGEGESSAGFTIEVNDNDVVDDNGKATITANAKGYPSANTILSIEDNEFQALSITASQREMTEGETLELTVSIPKARQDALTITIQCDHPERFIFDANLIIPAGSTSGTVIVATVDDNNPALDQDVTFKASCEGYQPDEAWVTLHDNDLPTMELTFTPATVSESSGPNAIVAKLRRLDHTDSNITITLSDDSQGDLFYEKNIKMPEGVTEVQFMIGVVDNAVVEGDRTVNVTAAIYIKSCSCSAQGGSAGTVTQTVTITDNDGPSLTVVSSRSTITKGEQTNLTITRNAAVDTPLQLVLSSNHDDILTYQHSLSFAAGKASLQVPVTVADSPQNDVTVTFTAEASNFSNGSCWIMVSNNRLPDAYISGFALSVDEAKAGENVNATVIVSNSGLESLSEATRIAIFDAQAKTLLATLYTPNPLAPGEAITLNKAIKMPNKTGLYELYAEVNDTRTVRESIYLNNKSENVSVTLTSPFSATLSTDKQTYSKGETVILTGSLSGENVGGKTVEVYIINEGLRQAIETTADNDGTFIAEFTPFNGQMGHFEAGACYPGEKLTAEMTSFDIYGLRRASDGYMTYDVMLNEPVVTSIAVANPNQMPQHNVHVNVISQPENYDLAFNTVSSINGNSTSDLAFTITGKELTESNKWEQAVIEVTSDEGSSFKTMLYLYCRYSQAKIKPDINAINTTMTKGKTRNYAFNIMNEGKGSTGKITLSLPSWMHTATPLTMPALEQGEQAQVVLQLVCTDDMELNVPLSGTIAINPEHGDGVAIPYYIEPVSKDTGTLLVDVTDCYTYQTAEAPHVQGAKVSIKHPTTGTLISEGVTSTDGTYSVELPEGYYMLSVTADKHDQYKTTILVDPGRENRELVYLTFGEVTVTWDVVETEIEDEYEIVHTYTYETNIPEPVITIDGPTGYVGQDMGIGDSKLLYFTITNRGLVSALDCRFFVPEPNDEWSYRILDYDQQFELAAHQAVVVPVMLTRLSMGERKSLKAMSGEEFQDCLKNTMDNLGLRYGVLCGHDIRENESAYRLALKFTAISCALQALTGGGGGGPSGPGNPNPGGKADSKEDDNHNPPKSGDDQSICNPEVAKRLEKTLDGAMSIIPATECVNEGINSALDYQTKGTFDWRRLAGIAAAGGSSQLVRSTAVSIVSTLSGWGLNIWNWNKDNKKNSKSSIKSKYDWMDEYDKKMALLGQQYWYLFKALDVVYGDSIWYLNDEDETMQEFWETVKDMPEETISYQTLLPNKPACVTYEQLQTLVTRVDNSFEGSTLVPRIDEDSLTYYCNAYLEYDKWAQEQGYETMTDLFKAAHTEYMARLKNQGNSVCAEISLQISQHLVMTRQAFLGTLTVTNGHETDALQDAKLTLNIIAEDGTQATAHEFEIQLKELKGFAGSMTLDGGWSLMAGETGTATVLFIPTKYAAPDHERIYAFGGSLSYMDPFTGLLVTRELYPEHLTVRPSPNLALDYFMQRDIFGDDPLTETVEPMQDAEFALIIDNQGHGDATDVRMITHKPEIIENEKGLLIDFEFVSSQLNGEDAVLALDDDIASDFGTIEAHSQAYAQWWMRSTLLGHFTSYDVGYTHLTSYGNEDLSLIDTIRVHELIRGFTTDDVAGNKMRGFLVNDLPDALERPDFIHFTNATQDGVAISNATISSINSTQFALTVTSAAPGWNYGWVYDPTHGHQKIVSIVRQSDNKTIYTDNMWTTDRTLLDGQQWLYENRLHYVVDIAGASETYLITFEPRPDTELAVESFGNIPDEGEVLTEPLTMVSVTFNKPIETSSFTAQDITLSCQGKTIDVSTIEIEPVNDKTFNLNLNGFTEGNGYYVLAVQTAGIKDLENYYGSTGKQASWLQFGGMIPLTVSAQPVQGGTVTPESGEFMFNEVVHLAATPSTGYRFSCWMAGDEIISYDSEVDFPLQGLTQLTAVFEHINCKVDINCDEEGGSVVGEDSQVCEYGTILTMTAHPANGYVFSAWIVNGETYSYSPQLTITVDGDMVIEAMFEPIGTQAMTDIPIIAVIERTAEFVKFHVEGNGTITVWLDGESIHLDENGNYTILADDKIDKKYLVTAIAQEPGKLASEIAELIIDVPAKNHSSLDDINSGKAILSVKYYGITGLEKPAPEGITIVVTTYTDGSVHSAKIVK